MRGLIGKCGEVSQEIGFPLDPIWGFVRSMRRAPRPKARAKTAFRGLASRALVLLTLVAFTLQGFLTQTHIHRIASNGAAPAVDVFDGIPVKDDKAPTKNTDQNCPLCQQFASAGAFVTPTAAAALAPTLSVSVIQLVVIPAAQRIAITHIWRGRAPPRHQSN
jgi:hypothetical protein